MAISGGIKFFKRSKCLFDDGTTLTVTSGTDAARYMLDKNTISAWRSVASNDVTTETIEITFNGSKTINRLLFLNHNWKSFTVKYFSGGSFVHFASVTGIGGSMSNITETVFADDTAYYEFTPVITTKIQIMVTTTQVANQEKYIFQVIATEELGTLAGYPEIKLSEFDRNQRKNEMLSGRTLTQKSEDSFKTNLAFRDYPPLYSADIDLIASLHDMEETFLIWLCGGRRGSTYFKKQLRGFRLQDAISVQLISNLGLHYTGNLYKGPVNFNAKFEETVD